MKRALKQVLPVLSPILAAAASADILDEVEHRYAENEGVRIHYAVAGDGPLVLMIHGFPDYWYSWRHQMRALKDRFRVAAMDQRGYNRSSQPEGVANYAMPLLVRDVAAVIAAEGEKKAIVVGHDWGGAVAWSIALSRPEMVDLLVILNLPHPNGLGRELRTNPQQQANSQYARDFQQPDAHKMLSAEGLAGWVADEDARAKYVEAFQRSSFAGMLNYYKANYPGLGEEGEGPPPPKAQMPVLMFHGLEDQALLPAALNDTWHWLEKDLTLVTIPGAGHFVQQDAAELVSATLHNWLLQRRGGLAAAEDAG